MIGLPLSHQFPVPCYCKKLELILDYVSGLCTVSIQCGEKVKTAMEGEEDLSPPSPSRRVPVEPPKCSEDEPSSPGTPSSHSEADVDDEVDSQGLCPFSRKTVLTFSTLSICCVAFLIFFRTHLFVFLNWLQEAPIWETLIVFVLLFTVLAFPVALGYLVLNVAAGYLYGFWWGMLVVVVSVTLGFSVAFHVCRLFLRDWVMDYVRPSKVATALVRIVEGDKGFKVIALARLTPVPFGIQNAILSVSNVHVYGPFTTYGYMLTTCTYYDCAFHLSPHHPHLLSLFSGHKYLLSAVPICHHGWSSANTMPQHIHGFHSQRYDSSVDQQS